MLDRGNKSADAEVATDRDTIAEIAMAQIDGVIKGRSPPKELMAFRTGLSILSLPFRAMADDQE